MTSSRPAEQHGGTYVAGSRAMKLRAEYAAWGAMKQRCYNPRCPNYRNYGARGIAVCDRWRDSFANFFADMGEKPGKDHEVSLDRIDNDANYSCGKCDECRAKEWPANCRWATAKEQAANTRRSARKGKEADGIRSPTLVCRDCQGVFARPPHVGRPPVRCSKCRAAYPTT